MKFKRFLAIFLAAGLAFGGLNLIFIGQAGAAERSIVLVATYPSVSSPRDREVNIDLKIINKGTDGEIVDLAFVKAPVGWDVSLRPQFTRLDISSAYVEAEKTLELEFHATPPKDVASSLYVFTLQATTKDKQLTSSVDINVTITGEAKIESGVKLNTQYPSLSGNSTSTFEFKVDLVNEGNEDLSFDVRARGPARWNVSIRPAWEQKEVSTVRVKARETQGLDVTLRPPYDINAGEFITTLVASSGSIQDGIELKAMVTGTYTMAMGTSTGRLNTDITAGDKRDLTIIIANQGTADLKNISLTASRPDDWNVTFSPDRIDTLEPSKTIEVGVKIEAPKNTIPGDYAVTLRTSAEQVSQSIDLRVTATVPTLWGWVGIIIVVLVVAGLATVFTIMGRR
ncbi:MAG: NEW3 domain-containing protein [Dehalococcoidia bacterium]|nr:NEW3 domain-containing protein [Dehalococcoidia bacterium]